jgi:hypothetical protein
VDRRSGRPVSPGLQEVSVTMRSGGMRLMALVVVAAPVLAVSAHRAAPALAQPPDQERTVVFELFTPPVPASGGG